MENIQKEFPGAFILDVSSTSPNYEGRVLSPFYPHGNIIVPGAEPLKSLTASCVEAVWQGLKVFEKEGEDLNLFKNNTGKNLKRSIRTHGAILGHRWLRTGEILNYFQARLQIYLPTYWGMLSLAEPQKSLKLIEQKSREGNVVLLDYNINTNFTDLTRPIAHAALIKLYIERKGKFPRDIYELKPLSLEESQALRKQEKQERQLRIKQGKKEEREQGSFEF